MHRTFWVAIVALGFAINNGCSMCESCFDYTYPAVGGRHCWEADDCCRAGSAFCHVAHAGGYGDPHAPVPIDEIHDPVPDAPGFVPEPTPGQEPLRLTPDDDLRPPTDLRPPVDPLDIPDTGAPAVDQFELPPLGEVE